MSTDYAAIRAAHKIRLQGDWDGSISLDCLAQDCWWEVLESREDDWTLDSLIALAEEHFTDVLQHGVVTVEARRSRAIDACRPTKGQGA